jgi:RNA polymerase sigma-70 factor (ECF subfamily)
MGNQQGVERILLRKAAQGNFEAFGEIIKRYQHVVYALAVQITRDRGAAKDVAQDTFITAFKR